MIEKRALERVVRALRDAPWLTPERVRAYACVLIATYVAMFAWMLSGSGGRDPLGRPIGTDFASFWTVSHAVLDGRVGAIYSPSEFIQLQSAVTGADAWYAWFYPPVALLVVAPLSLLPYVPAFLVWCAVSLAAYLRVLRAVSAQRGTLLVGGAFPAVFLALGHGQTSMLVTAALGAGLLHLDARPVVAGALLGTLIVKPQFALLVPIALVAGRSWRALVAAAVSAAALVGATVAWRGLDIWKAFLAVTPIARDALELGRVEHYKFQSTFAAVRLLGGSVGLAYGMQAAVTLAAVAAVVMVWRARSPSRIRNAVLVCAGVLATPFVLDYDLVLLALPAAWLAMDARERGWRDWEKTAIVAAAIVPILTRPVGLLTGVLLGPLAVAALLVLLCRRTGVTANGQVVAAIGSKR